MLSAMCSSRESIFCHTGGGGGSNTQFGGPIAMVLFFFWLAFSFFGFILALAGASALQNYIYKDDNVDGKDS